MRPGRWLLFTVSVCALGLMTYGGVLFAYSVPLSPAMLDANPDLPAAERVIVWPRGAPETLPTHAADGRGAYLVIGYANGTMPAAATHARLARALIFVEPGASTGATVDLVDVPSANGTTNFTIDVGARSGGAAGWIVMGAGEDAPWFVGRDAVIGPALRLASNAELALLLVGGFLGFLAPLAVVVATHRPRASPERAGALYCRECRAMLPASATFCLRCGAYQLEDANG